MADDLDETMRGIRERASRLALTDAYLHAATTDGLTERQRRDVLGSLDGMLAEPEEPS